MYSEKHIGRDLSSYGNENENTSKKRSDSSAGKDS